ncbi:MAG: valine--tRNA ligase [Patescibacteria group bacterium]
MDEKLLKPYDSKETEGRIYKLWEESGYFNPDNLPARHKEPFTIILPPPNVTGVLHMGHALTTTIEDIIIRYQRMKGKKTLWLPGTDHAAIATESKVERELIKKEGTTRRKLGKEAFLVKVEQFVKENQDTILTQLRKMGASLDWSRLAFTLDEKRQKAVYGAFLHMYKANLIYHGKYLVNWDPKGQTTVSDEEAIYESVPGILYTFKYSKDFPIEIATTRPETKVGDVAVAVHPNSKWSKYIGKKYEVKDFAGVKLNIEIIGDETVDPEFGVGAVGITPAHSHIDADIASRHNLQSKQVINEYGKIINARDDWNEQIGIKEAREKIIEWLKHENLLVKEEFIEHNVAKAQRSGGIIEVLPKRHQFFVNVNKQIPEYDNKTLKDLMREPVVDGRIKIIPENFKKIYLHWIDNLHDWNISRQVWYGHKIPAWYKDNDIKVGLESPGDGWQPIDDTFDTWFSSGLWTLSTLGWPDDTSDLKTYHPTSVLETGYDILFFWVAKMILMTIYLKGEIPFSTVYLHGLIRDPQKQKMSKSTGNVIDPLSIIEKFGTDALRMALVFNTAPGTDQSWSEEKVKGMKNFINKLWNIARFVLDNSDAGKLNIKYTAEDKDIRNDFELILKDASRDIENYRLNLAAEKLYQYIWHKFADTIIEKSKSILKDGTIEEKMSREKLLLSIFTDSIKALHPFIPFVTEEIWQTMKGGNPLMIEEWPI